MEAIDKLNAILRLRLFFSTEQELSEYVGYKLRGNNFHHIRAFQAEAYFCMFEKISKSYMKAEVDDLSTLLCQYEATSVFYKKNIERAACGRTKTFIPVLLDVLCHGKTDSTNAKDLLLCDLYINNEDELNIGILILLTYGLIPTFKHKQSQDVADIIGDFQKAYDILAELAESHKERATAVYDEMLCLREIREIIENEKSGIKCLNRLLLIHAVNDAINRILALERPDVLRDYLQEHKPMDFKLARFWRFEQEADNVVWEFEGTNIGHHYLHRKEICREAKQIRYTTYQLNFRDIGYRDFCYTIIMRPSYIYNNVLRRELTEESISHDYTSIEYADDKRTVKQLSFTVNSPLANNRPITLKPVEKEDEIDYYEAFIAHKGRGKEYVDVDNHPEYAIDIYTLEVAVAERFILFNFVEAVYRLDKYDADGNETVAGITSLTNQDNYVYAKLKDNGKQRRFLCLDDINQNLDADELVEKPYFRRIIGVDEVFG